MNNSVINFQNAISLALSVNAFNTAEKYVPKKWVKCPTYVYSKDGHYYGNSYYYNYTEEECYIAFVNIKPQTGLSDEYGVVAATKSLTGTTKIGYNAPHFGTFVVRPLNREYTKDGKIVGYVSQFDTPFGRAIQSEAYPFEIYDSEEEALADFFR